MTSPQNSLGQSQRQQRVGAQPAVVPEKKSDGWLVGSPKVQEEPDGSNFAQRKSEKLPELETWRLEMNGLLV